MLTSLGRATATVVVALLVAVAAPPTGTAAPVSDPTYTDWNARYPGFPSDATQGGRVMCASGTDDCIDRTIAEMTRRFHRMVPVCDHNNVFSLTYLRVTQDIRRGIGDGFYPQQDRHWINVLDATFARTYFLAYKNYRAGRTDLVPPSWRIALDAGAGQQVEGLGNLLLSMNAHVQRDFPFVLYDSGLVREDSGLTRPDGSSRKDVHDAYNARLRALYTPMLEELSRRFDASIDDYDVPGVVADDDAFFELLVQWRETAWDYAVRLADAKDDAERRRIAAEIEDNAVAWAQLIKAGSSYAPPVKTPEARNALCAEHGGQDTSYARGAGDAVPVGPAHLRSGSLAAPVRCLEGPGPCRGWLSPAGSPSNRTRFVVPAGEVRTFRLALADPGVSVALRAVSLLGPGDQTVRRRVVRVEQ